MVMSNHKAIAKYEARAERSKIRFISASARVELYITNKTGTKTYHSKDK
jgi:hypothetical protein